MLFRKEAVDSQKTKWIGEIVLSRPNLFWAYTYGSLAFIFLLAGFIYYGTYTQRNTVPGQLAPNSGLVRVFAPQYGIVLEKTVAEGQTVKRGDVLYVLSSERRNSEGNLQASISDRVKARQQSIQEEMRKTLRLQDDERIEGHKKLESLENERNNILSQVDIQQSRVRLASETVARWEQLLATQYISKEQVQQKQAEMLDQRTRLESLERDSLNISRDIALQKAAQISLPLRQQNQLAQLERQLMSAGQELAESEMKRALAITAPADGVATSVMAEIGQAVDTTKPILSIVPKDALLQAHLYAPSRSIGFVHPGDAVLLRYQSFPYQKFGHAKGKVQSISRAAATNNEFAAFGEATTANVNSSEPVYRITVTLDSQSIQTYGISQSLQPGMLLEADIMHEKRRLYEWVLEPLYSLTGKI